MSKNINQVYMTNPITSNAATDLMYFGQSPYGAADDAAMTYANFSAQFQAPITPAALTKTDDTNVTLTLGGSPSTALLNAASITAGWTGTLAPTRGGLGVSAIPTNGQIPIGNGTNYTVATLTAGTGISITNGAGTITIDGSVGFTWNDVAGTSASAVANNGYIISNAGATTITLPATVSVGAEFAVAGKGAGGWRLQANTGQIINFGSSPTSTAGYLNSTNRWDSVRIVCVTANTTFTVIAVQGILTVA